MSVVIMSAIPGELALLRERHDDHTITVESGIGKVNAASVATEVILRHDVSTLIFTGVAGGLDPSLSIGDIVIGRRTIQHDAGMQSRDGFTVYQAGHLPFFNPTDELGYRPSDELLNAAMEAARSVSFGDVLGRQPDVVTGTIVTGDQFVDDGSTRERLHDRFEAAAVEMEGAAVAQVADRLGVDCLVIRAVSDLAGADAQFDFMRFVESVAANSAEVTDALIDRL